MSAGLVITIFSLCEISPKSSFLRYHLVGHLVMLAQPGTHSGMLLAIACLVQLMHMSPATYFVGSHLHMFDLVLVVQPVTLVGLHCILLHWHCLLTAAPTGASST